MVRPRNALLASFPAGAVSAEEASETLRKYKGDLKAAKNALSAKLNQRKPKTTSNGGPRVASSSANNNGDETQAEESTSTTTTALGPLPERLPPKTVVAVNNLSDRQYCCVWDVEVLQDGYRPDVARHLLARVARHVNPILRARGWRVKRLLESTSSSWIGLCTTNGRNDADAASANIQLNLRTQPNKQCRTFRTFEQVLSVMLHEITHISIGLEDIHPPAFYKLLDEIRQQYYKALDEGEVALETDEYGCKNVIVSHTGELKTVEEAAQDSSATTVRDNQLGRLADAGECGARKRRRWNRGRRRKRSSSTTGYTSNVPKRRPLLKGAKMVDGRTKAAKQSKVLRQTCTPQELAARAALARWSQTAANETANETANDGSSGDDESSLEPEEIVAPHLATCGCRSCAWDKLFP